MTKNRIANRRQYPEAFKAALIKDFKAGSVTQAQMAIERNVSKSTVSLWLGPKTRTKKAKAPIVATPTGSEPKVMANGTIEYMGTVYTAR